MASTAISESNEDLAFPKLNQISSEPLKRSEEITYSWEKLNVYAENKNFWGKKTSEKHILKDGKFLISLKTLAITLNMLLGVKFLTYFLFIFLPCSIN